MHGHSPGIPHIVNAEVDSMGGYVDSGVDTVRRTSPHRVAIEKAQAEMRQEYDVREERRRELEFLDKGGNPLDFKFSNAGSLSIHSTSLTEQLADQYVLSEAKGSFALAASPHGDSVESSGRPAVSAGRESNTADNLLLFDENNNLDGGQHVKRTGKRGFAALEQSSKTDGGSNAKESDDSMMFRLGVKSQAYTRRHRSRPTRDAARVGSSDLLQGNSNRSSLVPPSHLNLKEPFGETRVQEHADSPLSLKATSPNGIAAMKVCGDDQVDFELDAVRNHTPTFMADEQPPGIKEAKISNNLEGNDNCNQHSQVVAEEIPNCKHSEQKGAASATPDFPENIKALCGGDKANSIDFLSSDMVVVHDENLNSKVAVDNAKNFFSRTDTDAETSALDGGRIIEVINDDCLLPKCGNESSNGSIKEDRVFECPRLKFENSASGEECKMPVADEHANGNYQTKNFNSNIENSCIRIKEEVESFKDRTDQQFEGRSLNNVANLNDDLVSKQKNAIDEASKFSQVSAQETIVSFNHGTSSSTLLKKGFATFELQNSASNQLRLAKKAREDAILKEARMIEANRKRAALLSSSNISLGKREKSHWDFVLEEMAWMANDFMQERIWKLHAAARVCHQIAYGGSLQFKQENILRSQKNVSLTLCKAIKHFWHSANVSFRSITKHGRNANLDHAEAVEVDVVTNVNDQGSISEKSRRDFGSVHDYAIRFLKCNISSETSLAEAPTTPDRLHDAGTVEMSWEDQLSEENLFYTVPPGAMQAYRESVEAQFGMHKKKVNNLQQEDGEASLCDYVADGQHGIAIEEDEGEIGTYALRGAFDRSTKFNHKKSKTLQPKSFSTRPYNHGTDVSYEPYIESKYGSRPFIYSGKRPSSTLNVGSIPTKRIRTAARQRAGSPSGAGPSKTDVSSGDTNSFQDDQSSLHGGSHSRKNLDVESTMDFERSLQFDLSEVSTKYKKKKKPKHLGFKNSFNLADNGILVAPAQRSSYEQRLQVDYMIQHEQMDLLKKRPETQRYDSNGNPGMYGQHASKKPKLSKQLPETPPETVNQVGGSMPSPVASQMSNMSNSNKLITIIANRDRKKNKLAKIAAGHSGPGSSWSLFEDQALVVLVHDLGPNWELVSDAINSTLKFKCIYRKPKECKERHKFLMDKSAGDGAESAEDSGSSQPYPSTLPGIPKGSARQLFQRLQGPMEEDTLKAHFEKIIFLGQQLHSFRRQHHIQELKQVMPPHNSHAVALSQACPNNLTEGVLTPLDLCDAINPSSDVLSLGFQGSHTTGLAIPGHQGSVTPMLPTSNASAMMNGSSGMVLGTSLPSPSVSLGAPARDGQRYGIPRQSSLPVEEQRRMQHYSQILSGRNIQQSNTPASAALPLGVDRGVRMLPATNGMGMMSGTNRGMPVPRPGLQGIGSPSMLNMASPGSMISASGVGMPNPVGVQAGAVGGPGSSMLRPRDPLQMLRSTEDHGQMMMQEFPMQVSQGNGQPVSAFNGVTVPFSTATVSPTIQTFSSQHHQQPHMLRNPHHSHIQGPNHSGPQQQPYAIRYAKERQLQQRMMSQSQHPFSGQNIASQIQNGSQVQPQSQPSSPITSISSSQSQHKPQPLARAQAGMQTQVIKQRQRPQAQQQQPQQQQPPQQQQQQQQQQTAKNHQLQRQQSEQQPKLVKGIGRAVMLHQNIPVDASHMNSLPANKNQVSEKHLHQQGQPFYSGNPVLNSALPQSSNQQKMFPRTIPQPSKQISAILSDSDTSNHGPAQIPPNRLVPSSQQPLVSPLPSASQPQQQQRQTNQAQQSMPKMILPQDRQMSSDGRTSSSSDAQVNQMVASTPISQCTDSVNVAPVVSTAQWKPEPQFDPPTTSSGANPRDNLVVSETKQGLVQRQSSGNLPVHGHGIGGQWQQQRNQQQQQQQHRQAAQGSLYARPSNSGPG